MWSTLAKFRQNSERCSLFLFVLLIGVFGLGACEQNAPAKQQVVFSGPIMGTEYRISVIKDGNISDAQIEKSIVGAMNSVNQSMSNYIDDSEISIFNRLPVNQSQKLSPDFSKVVAEAQSISKLSNGAFDITLGRAIDAWGFGPDGEIRQRPTEETLKKLRSTVGFAKILLDNDVLTKTVDGVEISLSAIAKGYAVDKVALALNDYGIANYLINIGGELRASGLNIDKQLWRVGIEKPHILGGIQEIVELDNVAIATSGDYRNYHIVGGQQFSHMIDSKTLSPVYHKLALVSVISQRASTADGLATAMMAMDETRAWRFAEQNGLAAYLIIRGAKEGEYKVRVTEKFRAYLQ